MIFLILYVTADDETLQRHLHLISQSSADIAAIPTDNNVSFYHIFNFFSCLF